MTRPQTWDWTESLTADPPSTAQQPPNWVAQEVFRPTEKGPDNGESGPEMSLAEFVAEARYESFAPEISDESESGEVELAEWELAGSPVQEEAFPSGLTLSPAVGATGEKEEHWDPYATKLPLWATGPAVRSHMLSPNFTVGELVTSGGKAADVARISPALVHCLQALRDRLGKPVTISSGYRSWARNVAVYRDRGSVPTRSRHCSGQAADISVAGMSGLDIAKAALDACGRDIGVGIGATFAHIDVRGKWERWPYASGDAAKRDIAAIDAHRRGLRTTPPTTDGSAYVPGGVPSGVSGSGAPSAGSLRAKIAQFAEQERARWSNGARVETESAMTATLQDYYRTGVGITVSASELQSSSWQGGHPWSAVFISWVMRQAGAGSAFAYSTAHREYVSAAKHNAEAGNTANPFWAYPVEKIVPEVGDLVCADRDGGGGCGGVTYATIDNGTAWSTHCDVVTSVDRVGRKLTAVGGNVSQSVKAKTIAIDAQGFVVPQQSGQTCRYFAILKVRDGTPSTSQQESGPAAPATVLDPDAAARAIRLNTSYAPALRWGEHLDAITRLTASPGSTPADATFANAVAQWQRGRGLTPDGVIGPDSWIEMVKVINR
ncbi:DUF2272 domain-containing protein [Streptomyces ureilyticus]|uniref:DUF2272 domain-containing protein n=1 Tax=Streptomyces ureilyticus TaxID=1775131 RepID=A0ABX0DYL9_9ACTN|nr:DUF2272 domain-containing protein [Streptomyces ureilyticus]NGO45740.1 DUF2272 domain-containing protein [Streptomyces ureilyticus]